MTYDCIIIGAGAAGLMCAATAGRRGRKTLVLDHANKVGKKILMSGGGRCNFTNLYAEPSNFLSDNPHFCKSALSRYTQYDFIALVDRHGLAYHEKTEGQLFCDNKAQDILNILLDECRDAGVVIRTDCEIHSVAKQEQFSLETSQGEFACHSVVVATGGLSIPTMGASGFGYQIAKQFGLRIKPRIPSLVPFIAKGDWLAFCQNLAGVALDINVNCGHQSFREAMLFTHRGISGPAILQITNYWREGESVSIDLMPGENLAELMHAWKKEGNKSELKTMLARQLPKRFVHAWLEMNGYLTEEKNKAVNQYSDSDIDTLTQLFHQWEFKPAGTEGYRTAEVTLGGVDTDDVSSKTLEAKTTPGLYFVGEVLDVTGWLGGFNFQWAWASGHCAGQYA